MNSIGVIVARFQSPYLHEGHKALLQSVKKDHNRIVIVLGVSPVRSSRRNPLDFHTREKMIKKEFPEVVVLPIPDHPLDNKWSQNLDTLLTNSFPGSKFKLYGSRKSFIPHYTGKSDVVELPETGEHSATLIREQISDRVLDTEEFRTGIIYACSNVYEKVYPTVDIAVFRNQKAEMLMGRKTIDNKWRLLGGFADPTDESFENAARRELTEECGPIEITDMIYEKSFRVNDWRYRSEVDKIITTLFSTDFINGNPMGSDDIAEVRWFRLAEVAALMEQHDTAEEHYPQLSLLMNKYNSK
ncbi:MAG: NUDIX domain-containing protein [Cyclobacteriaceae bacterium]|nr:NUDIX domain-containing protein [Cyclobacteriaceae bacterium]